jgi:hypothetical protein
MLDLLETGAVNPGEGLILRFSGCAYGSTGHETLQDRSPSRHQGSNMLPIIRRALRAAAIFLSHASLGCVLVFGTWVVDQFIRLLSGSQEILIYGVLPLSYRLWMWL